MSSSSADIISLCLDLMRGDIRLRAINSIESLVQEQANRPTGINPRRTILIQGRIVPKQRQDVDHDEGEADQGDHVRGHPHGKTFYDKVGIEGLEDITRQERMVNTLVLVFLQVRKLFLSHVNHDCA